MSDNPYDNPYGDNSQPYGESPYSTGPHQGGPHANGPQPGRPQPGGGPQYTSAPTGPAVNTTPFRDPYQPDDHPSNQNNQPAMVRGVSSPAVPLSAGSFSGSTSFGSDVTPDTASSHQFAAAVLAVCGLLMFAHAGVVGLAIAAIAYAMSRSSYTKGAAALCFNTVAAYTAAILASSVVFGLVGAVAGGHLADTVGMILRYGFGAGLVALAVLAFNGRLLRHPVQLHLIKN